MVVISTRIIREFISRFPLSASALNKWNNITMNSDWKNFTEVKKTWNTCDSIGNDRYLFDIAGNNFRLIAMIHFDRRTLYIRGILSHQEYTTLSKKGRLNSL
jgi:mRNA interferase HigB